jgi:Tfp pilus assembly protein PilF
MQLTTARILLISTVAIASLPAQAAPVSSGCSNQKTELNLHDRFLTLPQGTSALLDMAIGSAKSGDRVKLAKLYKLGLLTGQSCSSDYFHTAMCDALGAAQDTAKEYYRDGDIGEAIERLRLFFNLITQLNEQGYSLNTNEVDEWLAASKIMTLPKENCIGALNDYGFFLNCSGQYDLAIPVLKAVIRESPDRAIAYSNLADAEWYSGKRTEAQTNYHNYRDLTAQQRNAANTHSNLSAEAGLQANWQNRPHAEPQTNDPLQKDVIAVLSTKGRLIPPGITPTPKLERTADILGPSQWSVDQIHGDLPWLEDIYRDADRQQPRRALTDQSSHKHPLRQTTRHGVLPSSLQRCIELNDEAILALQDRQPEDAIKTLNQAMEVDPGCLLTLRNLAVAFNNMAIDKSDQPKLALKSFHQALALAPFSHTVRSNTNAMLMRMGKNPSSFQARIQLGREFLEHGDYLSALVEYREALRLKADPQVKEMIAALTQQMAVEELMPPPQLSASLDWKHAVEASRFARKSLAPN